MHVKKQCKYRVLIEYGIHSDEHVYYTVTCDDVESATAMALKMFAADSSYAQFLTSRASVFSVVVVG